MRFTLTAASLALAAGSAHALSCTNLAEGKLAVVNGEAANGLGLAPVTDADGDGYLQQNANPTLFTFQACDSSYMGFPKIWVGDGKLHANGRYVLNGKCLLRESDGAIALKTCSTKDDASLAKEFFSVFWQGSEAKGTAVTRLLGGPSSSYPDVMYTEFSDRRGNNIIKQLPTAPASGSAFSLRFTTFPVPE